ncbi:nitroreductase family deazaflavin-dependent oxidoreductase [soil metagenome]
MPHAAFASPVSEQPTDSPDPRVAEQIRQYLATDGALPRHPSGSPLLLLTTRGRTSGSLRRTMLIFGRSADELVVVASRGGNDSHPAWYGNLLVHPNVETQVGASVTCRIARTLEGDERAEAWELMVDLLPAYESMQASTDREFPVVALGPTPPRASTR